MNRRLTISLLVNIILLGVIAYHFRAEKILPPAPRESSIAKIPQKRIVRVTRTIEATNVEPSFAKFDWRTLESEDYPTYLANLRAIRCPEKTIFQIIFADIEKLYAERKKKLEASGKFWVIGEAFEKARLEKAEPLFELQEEKRALIKLLLNSDLDWEILHDAWYDTKEFGMGFGFLQNDVAEQMLSIVKKYGDRIERVDTRAGSLKIPEDAVEKLKIYGEMTQAVGKIVSPADLEEVELRLVAVMSFMGSKFKEIQLTGAELRELTKLRLQFANPILRELTKSDGADGSDEWLDEQKFLSHAKIFFGEARFKQYLRGTENDFDKLCELTEKNGLRPQSAMSVYEIQQAAVQEAYRIRENRTAPRKELRLELQSVEQSARDAVEQILGQKAAAIYATNGGNWLAEFKKP